MNDEQLKRLDELATALETIQRLEDENRRFGLLVHRLLEVHDGGAIRTVTGCAGTWRDLIAEARRAWLHRRTRLAEAEFARKPEMQCEFQAGSLRGDTCVQCGESEASHDA